MYPWTTGSEDDANEGHMNGLNLKYLFFGFKGASGVKIATS